MTTLVPTLSLRIFPRTAPWLRDLILITVGALFVAALAQVKIPLPFTPVPITGQTFAVLLVGAALGSARGASSLILYTAMGAVGLPFFAGGGSGLTVLTGPTLGYLVGFIVAAYVIGLLAERGLERSMRTSIVPFLVGTIIIYVLGAGWLAIGLNLGLQKALVAGVYPFLIGDAIKIFLSAVALPAAWNLAK